MQPRKWWVAVATSMFTFPGLAASALSLSRAGQTAENQEDGLRLVLPSTEILPATILTVSVALFLTVSILLLFRRPA